MIVFPFVKFYSKNLGIVKRPFARVRLIHLDRRASLPMLIDSGADISVISYKRGLGLGLAIEKGEPILSLGGISGGIPVVYRNLKVQIEDHIFSAKVAWSLIEEIPEILGRSNVFDEFDIELKQTEGIAVFRKR